MSIVFIRFLQSFLLSRKSLVVFIHFLRPNLSSHETQQFLSIFYNPVYRVTKASSFYQFPVYQFPKRQQVSPISHTPTYRTKISQQLLLISYNPTYRITKIQQFLSFFTTAFISLQNLISFCQFLTPLLTPSVFINFIQSYLSGHKHSRVVIIFFTILLIILKNFIRLHQFLIPLLIGPQFTNGFYQFLTTQLIEPQKLSSLIPTYQVTKTE